MRSAVKIQGIGIATCALIAATLPFLWKLWPLRLVYVDLFFRYEWSHFGAALAGIVPLLLAFEVAVAVRSQPFLRRKPALAVLLSSLIPLGLLLSVFWLYPKVAGHLWSERALRCPSRVTISYVETGGFSGSSGLLVTTRDDIKVRSRKDLGLYGDLSPENASVMVVSEPRMAAILVTLREKRFFEMPSASYLEGTIDGLWKILEVDIEGRKFAVHSYASTDEGDEFDRLLESLRDSHGFSLPQHKPPLRD